jgi:pSer/pThr/pTyr-binding forkhead associated (FHA) protein
MPLRLRLLPSPAPTGGADRGPTTERAIELRDGIQEVRIGRRPDVELPLPFPSLSGLHARLMAAGDGWRIEDLGSTNGTWVDGGRVGAGETRALNPGAQLLLGEVTLSFDGVVSPILGAEGTATIARRLVSDLFAAAPGTATPTLTIVSGVRTGPGLRLDELDRRYLVGRIESCDLPLPSEEISREHAAFVRLWDGVVVKDLGSKNGVLVNEALVTAGEQRLRDGDLIRMGPATLRLSDPADRYLRDLEARDEAKQAVAPPAGTGAPVAAPEAMDGAPAPVAGAPTQPLAENAPPEKALPARGARTAIIVAAAVLLIVGVVVLALALG